MQYFLDIQILPSQEIAVSTVLNEVFSRLHIILGQFGNGEIGVSFPQFHKTLGGLLRLHGQQSPLEGVLNLLFSRGLRDYVKISAISPIPEKVRYRVVSRVQVKSNTTRLLRRSVRKGWLTEEEAILQLSERKESRTSFPFIRIKSLSNMQDFRLFISHGPLLDSPQKGLFSSYGLSTTATIPWF